jgi:hypothetical protein
MIRVIFTMAVILGMAGSANAEFNPKNPKALMCSPFFATASVNGVHNKEMSDSILKQSYDKGEYQLWLYTPEYTMIKDSKPPHHTWIGVKSQNGVSTVAEMNFVSMYHNITSTAGNNVGILVNKCEKR